MTDLDKAVRRRTTILLDNRMKARSRDQITVSLYPNSTIGFRQKGRRKEFILPLSVCYKLAIIETEKEERKTKPRRRQVRRSVI